MEKFSYNNVKPAILIPGYMPDEKLVILVRDLREKNFEVIVVNDGSDKSCDVFFEKCKKYGAVVIEHRENFGKGKALKTGFEYCIKNNIPCVSADADGQHLITDIEKIAKLLDENPDNLILGVRIFDKTTPLRSKVGNYITRKVFHLLHGRDILDTQTGLRGFSVDTMKKFIEIPGDRYEYEMNMLLALKELDIKVTQEEIKVVYIDDNESSHFNPVKDSIIIYKQILKFVIASGSSGVVDYLIFLALQLLGVNIFISTYVARGFSSLFNFTVNKKFVFKNEDSRKRVMIKYYILAFVLAFFSFLITTNIEIYFSIDPKLGKIIADGLLYVFSYTAQKIFVFNKKI